jgi:16S rRNA (guanine1207-N2)-methyltransferase
MSPGHYFDVDPAVPSRPGQVVLSLPDFQAPLTVDRGVFSAGGVDPGTVELLRASPAPPPNGDLLDLGCGYGAIACTLAHRVPAATVWAVDVNRRALELTARNAAALGLAGVRPARPEAVPASVRFAGIWSNPPVRVGKTALHELLRGWLPRLRPEGAAWLVVHRHLGADSLTVWLADEGWRVIRVGSKRGYRILRVAPS